MERDISHDLSTRLAQRFGGRHSDYRVAMLDDIGTQYIVVVRSGDFRNQMCRAPTFQLITSSYEGLIVLRPWTRASGGFIERPMHYLKVRLQGVPLHLWREGLIQYLCSGFGTVLSIGNLSGFRSFRVLLMGKHPALVPRELMKSQDPVVKFADVVLKGWALLFQPPHNVQPVGPAMPWIPPYQPPQDDGSDESELDSQHDSGQRGYQFGAQPAWVHQVHDLSFTFKNDKCTSSLFINKSLVFNVDLFIKAIRIFFLGSIGEQFPIFKVDHFERELFKFHFNSLLYSHLPALRSLSLNWLKRSLVDTMDFICEDGSEHISGRLVSAQNSEINLVSGDDLVQTDNGPLDFDLEIDVLDFPPGFEEPLFSPSSPTFVTEVCSGEDSAFTDVVTRRSPRLKAKLNGPHVHPVDRATFCKYGREFSGTKERKKGAKKAKYSLRMIHAQLLQ